MKPRLPPNLLLKMWRDSANLKSPDTIKALRALRESGVPAADIAELHRCSVSSVYRLTRKKP